ncbi:DUF2306 domain-containing protein [Allonocardiopsis opalescens]|uniref:Putative membrane protein DUF2306 n=1 Tax=Allonocardiopsis opalescens TaxID=1144618 RepID=A0A2T0PZ13_9ACTN|nr:DUF2306 domain-containing protein [Allonocardiopsis opalescens]PRX96647.1 putative membrane protein DUF2306 [Allonocardiopsis opalescens]
MTTLLGEPDRTGPAESEQEKTPERRSRRPGARRHLAWLVPMSMAAFAFVCFSIPPYLTFDPAQARFPVREDVFFHYPLLVSHVIFGSLALLITCVQMSPWVRRRRPALHRWSGRAYVLLGVPFVGVSALILVPLSATSIVAQVGSFMWGLLWLSTTIVGYRMARRRRYADHQEWMVRSFALIWAIVLNRPWSMGFFLALSPQVDTLYGGDMSAMIADVGAVSVWISWVVNLIAAELWLRYRRTGRRPARPSRQGAQAGAASA